MSVHSSSFVADRLSLPDALARWPKRLRKSPGNSRPYLDGNVTSHQLRNRHLRPCHHMQPILDHIAAIVRPGLRNYATAEKALTDAQLANDAVAIADARREVILAARQAVDGLHHLADFVFNEPSPALPKFRDLEAVRRTVEAKCIFLREPGVPVKDVTLLRDVAVAFKHHRPTSWFGRSLDRHRTRGRGLWRRSLRRRQIRRCGAGHGHDGKRRQASTIIDPSECVRRLDGLPSAATAANQRVLGPGCRNRRLQPRSRKPMNVNRFVGRSDARYA